MALTSMLLCLSVPVSGSLIRHDTPVCKAYPGSSTWPSASVWQALNDSVSHQLLQPLPPAAVCHPNEPVYNNASCLVVQSEWTDSAYHADNPISVDSPNWSDDCCLPIASAPCSGSGYPVYVINATTPSSVQAGVNFARENNIRLVVKGTGHDYLGRSIAPNSLSIWTHHMRGLQLHDSFQPSGCGFNIETPAITVAAGEQWVNIYTLLASVNQTAVGPVPGTIGVGGHTTGGGHSPLSALYGLAADQVLEMEVVTPSGEIVVANECQNGDLFWALRGGGGATFAVITSITFKTFPSPPVASLTLGWACAANASAYWEALAYLTSQYPSFIDAGVYGYTFSGPSVALNESLVLAGYEGVFLSPTLGSDAVAELFGPVLAHINTTWPDIQIIGFNLTQYPDFFSWWKVTQAATGIGSDEVVGNRLLDRKALSSPLPALEKTLRASSPDYINGVINQNLVAGPGLWNKVPRGGSDSVHPGWRKAYVEFVAVASWTPLNAAEKAARVSALVDDWLSALEELAGPESGCYINEDNPFEPDLNDVFWGSNYPRLLAIKHAYDPDDVLWCSSCVGREGWHETSDGRLCRESELRTEKV